MKRMNVIVPAIAIAVAISSCYQPASVPCASGNKVCPPDTQCAAHQDICIRDLCGNGDVDNGEVCDDGNVTDGDGCSHDCKSSCGNGVIDNNEVCDDSNNSSGDGCSADCKSTEICGNGITDITEVCDDSNTASGDGCSSDCHVREGCGNGVIDPTEDCDDGNTSDEDNCLNSCKGWSCGDGFVNDAGLPDGGRRELCDDARETVMCNANCTSASCGDFVVNVARSEECDRGGIDTDVCDFDCSIPVCGDGYINRDAGERCDDSSIGMSECDYGTADCTACRPNCFGTRTLHGPYCGNRTIDPLPDGGNEACDDNTIGKTLCSYGTPTCTACDLTCTQILNLAGPYCGNQLVDPLPDGGVERCDNLTNGMTSCSYGTATCTACNATCTATVNLTGPYCGNQNREAFPDGGLEACDDSTIGRTSCPYGTPSCTACNTTCTAILNLTGPYCGNLSVDQLPDGGNERCDDTSVNWTSCPYGLGTCQACNATCTGVLTLTGPSCGDQSIDMLPDGGVEVCDDDTIGRTSCDYGIPSCTACNSTCTQRVPLTGPFCGDGNQNGSEVCDDGNTNTCGTCSPGCDEAHSGAATGTINAISGDKLKDSQTPDRHDTFTLDDGSSVATFEFDTQNDGVDINNWRVDADCGVNPCAATTVASRIVTAINAVAGPGLNITAVASGSQVVVVNTQVGQIGNRLITEAVNDNGFTVSGMSGGGGFDCGFGVGCATNQDCKSNFLCLTPDGGSGPKFCQ